MIVASITPQARASLAERFGLSTAETHARLLTFLRERQGVHHLVDSSLGADFSLLEAGEEFVRRWRHSSGNTSSSDAAGPQESDGGDDDDGRGCPQPARAAWAAPPPTVALSSTRRFNVDLGREESNHMQQEQAEQQRQEYTTASNGVGGGGINGGMVSGKRVREDGGSAVSGGGRGGGGLRVGEGGSRGQRAPGELLVLTSACPGWVCYAEKTAPEALPFMSTVRSPQQVRCTTSRIVSTRTVVRVRTLLPAPNYAPRLFVCVRVCVAFVISLRPSRE